MALLLRLDQPLQQTIVPFFVLVTLAIILGLPHSASAQKGEAEIFLAQATIAYDDEKYEEAQALLQKALSRDPQNSRVLYYLGLTHLALDQPLEAIPVLKTATNLRPEDLFIKLQLGVAHFAIDEYDAAAPLLFDVYKEQPFLENLGFYVGFLRYREQNYEGALEALNVNKSTDPDIQQLNLFYRGLVLGTLGLPERAIEELDLALEADPVSPLTQGALQLRDSLLVGHRPNQGKKRFRVQFNIGGLYDDNVAINPDKSNDPLAQNLRSRKTTSPGMILSALLDYAWLRQGPFESTVNYSFFQTFNFNDNLSRFNTQDHLVGIGGFYRGTLYELPYQVGLEYSFDYLLLDETAFLSRHNPTLSVLFVEPTMIVPLLGSVGNLTNFMFRYQIKEFYNEPANRDPRFFGPDIRDGFNTMVGLTHIFRFSEDKHFLRFGYQYDNENTEGSNFTYRGHRFLTGAQASLPTAPIRLRYSLDIHWRKYNAGPNTFFPSTDPGSRSRKDTQYIHLVQLIEDLPKNFSLIFQYQHLRNKSNLAIYDYTKNVFSVIVNWSY